VTTTFCDGLDCVAIVELDEFLDRPLPDQIVDLGEFFQFLPFHLFDLGDQVFLLVEDLLDLLRRHLLEDVDTWLGLGVFPDSDQRLLLLLLLLLLFLLWRNLSY